MLVLDYILRSINGN